MPTLGWYRFARQLWGEDRALAWAGESLANRPGPMGVLMRAVFYRAVLDHVGVDVSIGFGTCFSRTAARLGDRVYLGRHCSVGWVDIGDEARIADGVQLLSGSHHHAGDPDQLQLRRIRIGKQVWIGAGAVVMADIGDHARIAAGAVVVHPVPAGYTVAGSPARPVRRKSPPDPEL